MVAIAMYENNQEEPMQHLQSSAIKLNRLCQPLCDNLVKLVFHNPVTIIHPKLYDQLYVFLELLLQKFYMMLFMGLMRTHKYQQILKWIWTTLYCSNQGGLLNPVHYNYIRNPLIIAIAIGKYNANYNCPRAMYTSQAFRS